MDDHVHVALGLGDALHKGDGFRDEPRDKRDDPGLSLRCNKLQELGEYEL